jgi:peroxiredoxin
MVETPSKDIQLGSPAPDFSLPNLNPGYGGQSVDLSDFDNSKALLIVFMCNHCPYVVHIAEALASVAGKYQPQGLGVAAINVNDVESYPQDAPDLMTAMSRKYDFTFPYLYDQSQRVALDYSAVCTPDLYLFDSDKRLAYHGQFDDARPGNNKPVTGADLSMAIEQVLRGESVGPVQSPSVGCNIKWKPGIES